MNLARPLSAATLGVLALCGCQLNAPPPAAPSIAADVAPPAPLAQQAPIGHQQPDEPHAPSGPQAGPPQARAVPAAAERVAATDPAGTEGGGNFVDPSGWQRRGPESAAVRPDDLRASGRRTMVGGAAEEARDMGDWAAIARELDARPEAANPGPAWLRERARAAAGLQDWERCVEFRAALMSADPEDPMVRFDLARDLQRAGRGLEGAMLLETLTSDEELGILALRALGELYVAEDRLLDAAETYERLAQDPRVPDRNLLLQNASNMREDAGDEKGSLRVLAAALEDAPLEDEDRRSLDRLQAFETGRPATVDDATALLALHPNASFRYEAVRFLADRPFEGAARTFRAALGDENPRVATIAMREYVARAGEAASGDLVHMLSHTDTAVRREALRALSGVGGLAEVPAVLPFLDPTDRSGFRAANLALERMTGRALATGLDPDAAQRADLAAAWNDWWRSEGRRLLAESDGSR